MISNQRFIQSGKNVVELCPNVLRERLSATRLEAVDLQKRRPMCQSGHSPTDRVVWVTLLEAENLEKITSPNFSNK